MFYKNHNASEEINIGLMPKYNTEEQELALISYGRNIQKMLDYCLTIKDRKERTRCAYTIAKYIQVQRNRRQDESTKLAQVSKIKSEMIEHVVWDHLYFMSGNSLDIDFPDGYVPVKMDNSEKAGPQRIEYPQKSTSYRHYGMNAQRLIDKISDMQNSPQKMKLIEQTANFMKRCYMRNIANVEDKKIFDDIRTLSGNRIILFEEDLKLINPDEVDQKSEQKSKKKKKK